MSKLFIIPKQHCGDYYYYKTDVDEMLADKDEIIKLLREDAERLAGALKIAELAEYTSLLVERNPCPHGTVPHYPTHAWWCDKCFQEALDAKEAHTDLMKQLDGNDQVA